MLRPKKKLSRKEIKEDPLVTYYVKTQKFYQNYNKQISMGLMAVAIIIVLTVLIANSKRKAEAVASSKLGLAEQFYFSKNYEQSIDELQPILDVYPGTKAAGCAAFYIGNSYFELDDYENAERYYSIYSKKYKDNPIMTASSMAGLAACLEHQDQFEESAQHYEKTAIKYSKLFNAPFYLKEASRCYVQAGLIEKGQEVAQLIIDQYPDSEIGPEMQVLIESL